MHRERGHHRADIGEEDVEMRERKFLMKRKIPKHSRRGLSYEERIRGYEREKNELFFKIADMPAEEVAKAHEALIRKWGI